MIYAAIYISCFIFYLYFDYLYTNEVKDEVEYFNSMTLEALKEKFKEFVQISLSYLLAQYAFIFLLVSTIKLVGGE